MQSEIVKIRARIEQEIAALHQAWQYAIVARHETITHHFDRLSICFEELKEQIGELPALGLLVEEMERGRRC